MEHIPGSNEMIKISKWDGTKCSSQIHVEQDLLCKQDRDIKALKWTEMNNFQDYSTNLVIHIALPLLKYI